MSQQTKKSVLIVGTFLSKHIHTRSVCEDLSDKLSAVGWDVYRTSSARTRIPRVVDMVWSCLRYRKHYALAQIDVYSGSAFAWAELVSRILTFLQKPYVLTLHGGNLPEFARENSGRVSRLFGSAAKVTTPSRYLLDALQSRRPDMEMLPNPIEIERYSYRLRNQPSPNLVWLRALHDVYNPMLALHVLERLQRQYPDARLALVGPDKGDGTKEKVLEHSERSKFGGKFNLVGGVAKSDVPHWLDQADVFLNTSNIDNTPISVIEAMASGLCIVSTDVGGMRHLLRDGENALLVPPNDPDAMTAAVERLFVEAGLAEKLSAHARRASEQFDWSVILPRWETLFLETLHAR